MNLSEEADKLAEQLLIGWAAWFVGAGQARGLGGYHDEANPGAGKGSGHSDPVLSEVVSEIMHNREYTLVHDLLAQQSGQARKAVLLRYCGTPKSVGPRLVYGGFQTLVGVATVLNITPDAVSNLIAKAKADLLLALKVARLVRAGILGNERRAA